MKNNPVVDILSQLLFSVAAISFLLFLIFPHMGILNSIGLGIIVVACVFITFLVTGYARN